MANVITLHRGYNTAGGTAQDQYDITGNSWSTLANSRPDPSGTAPSAHTNGVGGSDGTYDYFLLKDGKLYRRDSSGVVSSALNGGVAVVSDFTLPWHIQCDGQRVFIADGDKTLRIYDIASDSVTSVAIPIVNATGTITHIAMAWDYGDYLYIHLRDNSDNKDFLSYRISTGDTLALTHAASTYPFSLTCLDGILYGADSRNCIKYDPTNDAGGWTTFASSVFSTTASSVSIFAVANDKLIATGNASDHSRGVEHKGIAVPGGSISTLAAPPADFGDAIGIAYSIPMTRKARWLDKNQDPWDGTLNIGRALIGYPLTYELFVEATIDLTGVVVSPPASASWITVELSTDGSTWTTAAVSIGAMTSGDKQPLYVRYTPNATAAPGVNRLPAPTISHD